MTYTPDMNSMSQGGGAYRIDQVEIERVLKKLISRQSSLNTKTLSSPSGPSFASKESEGFEEGWQAGQLEFARRIAQISMKHAAQQRAKITWKHRSIGLLRRLSLLVMVATVMAAQFL